MIVTQTVVVVVEVAGQPFLIKDTPQYHIVQCIEANKEVGLLRLPIVR